MNNIQDWSDVIVNSFQDLWTRTINFLPSLIGAIIVLLVGWAIAIGLGKLVTKIVEKIWLDEAVKKLGITDTFEKAGIKINVANALGFLVKWFLAIVFLIAAMDILSLNQVSVFLNKVLAYIPNVIIAVVILFIGVLFGNWVHKVVKRLLGAGKLHSVDFIATVAKWSIVVFSVLAALVQLNIAPGLLQIVFTGLIAMLAIAGGLAFGLGGKEEAGRIIDKIKKDVSSER